MGSQRAGRLGDSQFGRAAGLPVVRAQGPSRVAPAPRSLLPAPRRRAGCGLLEHKSCSGVEEPVFGALGHSDAHGAGSIDEGEPDTAADSTMPTV